MVLPRVDIVEKRGQEPVIFHVRHILPGVPCVHTQKLAGGVGEDVSQEPDGALTLVRAYFQKTQVGFARKVANPLGPAFGLAVATVVVQNGFAHITKGSSRCFSYMVLKYPGSTRSGITRHPCSRVFCESLGCL